MSECVIAVDVGGTAIKAGLVDPTGTLHAPRSVPTDRAAGADGVVGQVVACIQELETGARRAGHTPVAVGVAVLGLTDDEAGIAVLSANMGWRDVPLRALLQEKTALPVAFGHDVRAGGLAEAVLGAGRGAGLRMKSGPSRSAVTARPGWGSIAKPGHSRRRTAMTGSAQSATTSSSPSVRNSAARRGWPSEH